jgi:hypothetical protein
MPRPRAPRGFLRCKRCHKSASFGRPGSLPDSCSDHKGPGYKPCPSKHRQCGGPVDKGGGCPGDNQATYALLQAPGRGIGARFGTPGAHVLWCSACAPPCALPARVVAQMIAADERASQLKLERDARVRAALKKSREELTKMCSQAGQTLGTQAQQAYVTSGTSAAAAVLRKPRSVSSACGKKSMAVKAIYKCVQQGCGARARFGPAKSLSLAMACRVHRTFRWCTLIPSSQ